MNHQSNNLDLHVHPDKSVFNASILNGTACWIMVIVYRYVSENEESILPNIETNIVVLYSSPVCAFFVFNAALSFNRSRKIHDRKFSSLKIIYGKTLTQNTAALDTVRW